jgi:ATP-dependent DNA helicase PIF1
VPIFRSNREWIEGSVTLTRTQCLLTEAYAITIHKSQGVSVNRIVMTPSGKKDFAPGLTYVAMSRVRSLKSLLIEEPFSLERLRYKPMSATVWALGYMTQIPSHLLSLTG